MTTATLEAKLFTEDIIREKNILDRNTGKPVKEIIVEEEYILIQKESGEERVPLNTLRGKAIYTRLTTGVAEFTEPIYV